MNADGCSGEQLVDLDCQCYTEPAWKNHGQYVSCAAHAAEDQLAAGLITPEAEKDDIVSARAKSGCGKKKQFKFLLLHQWQGQQMALPIYFLILSL